MRMIFGVLFLAVVSIAHAEEPAFRFPMGDVAKGKEAFARLACNQCHSTKTTPIKKTKTSGQLDINLGERERFVNTYLDIVTAITNPQHVTDAKYADLSPELYVEGTIATVMPSMNDVISARDLMDLVAYIDSLYQQEKFYNTPKTK